MCGIVGVVAKHKSGLFKPVTDVFTTMLWVDQLRGIDGTGIFWDGDKECEYLKTPDAATNLIGYKNYDAAIADAVKHSRFLVGHNRAATRGKLSWKNTHPFQEGNITMVHNGTLNTYKELDDKVDVDSHAICKYMDKHGTEKTIKTINGAFALVWHDASENTLNLARNTKRPLALVETHSCWFISSEAGIAKMCIERAGHKVINELELEPSKLYQFELDQDCTHFHTYDLELKPEPVYVPFHGGTYNRGKSKLPGENLLLPDLTGNNTAQSSHSTTKYHAFGERIIFKPLHHVDPDSKENTALFVNQNKTSPWSHWLHGVVKNETNAYVKVYAPLLMLKAWDKATHLEGTINLSVFRGKNHIYTVENVVEIFDVDAKKIVGNCTVCDSPITQEELPFCSKESNGTLQCPDCTHFFEKSGKQPVWPYN